PSVDPDYVDEVDLGNGHTWRRKEDGTWCRFTKKTLCNTTIPKAPAPVRGRRSSARLDADRARAATAKKVAEEAAERPGEVETLQQTLWSIYTQVRVPGALLPGNRINFELLTEEDLALFKSIFGTEHPSLVQLRDAADRAHVDELLTMLEHNAEAA